MESQNTKLMRFSIRKLEVKSLILTEEATNLMYAKPIPLIDFNIVPEAKINIENKIFSIFLKISANYKINDEKRDLGEIITLTEFVIENMEDFINEKDGEKNLNIPNIAATTLISIAFSSTRGLLIGRSGGTVLGIAALPIIDPKVFTNVELNQSLN
jgi:hypothetical protein